MHRLPKPVPVVMLWLAVALLPLSAVAQDETVRLNKLIEMFQRGNRLLASCRLTIRSAMPDHLLLPDWILC